MLIVDRDQDQLDLLAENFRRCGCIVALATDGEQAARVASTIEPDIAVVDLLLPILDGWELVAHFRRSRPEMRIVVSSVLETQYYPVTDGVLPKPFLQEHVWRLLDRLSPAPVVPSPDASSPVGSSLLPDGGPPPPDHLGGDLQPTPRPEERSR